ncbi:DUF488 family protein [Rhodoblastus sp.]|jgi:uncharacterized protein YeaO (DUF488 family)|uniref:DUF488 domain-containing protein n=1 Tax=Rhodoblastus sp. TaxID=1962975 RepID=UPI0026324287|nr:DUF488 family protein [Rhodoblastus sp.]
MDVRLKRAYLPPSRDDGARVLVDRLWPRGLSKDAAAIDLWLKDVAPSTELRRWYGHDPNRWLEFQNRYREELANKDAALEILARIARDRDLTLVYAARDEQRNHALVIRDALRELSGTRRATK